jgi:hypothetical protein
MYFLREENFQAVLSSFPLVQKYCGNPVALIYTLAKNYLAVAPVTVDINSKTFAALQSQ